MQKVHREPFYGLPREVIFCKRCVMSNQRPASIPEFRHDRQRTGAKYLCIDREGICDACRHAENKRNIDWAKREGELLSLLDKHRRSDGQYDCIIPGSGGKDSVYQSHILKYKYGMNPLTVTWPPILYTEYGYKNFRRWIEIGGFDNLSFNQNGQAMRTLTRLAIENLLHPFQTFILGQKNLAPKIASKMGIPLIFYGENEAEYGNPIADNAISLRDKSFFAMSHIDDMLLAGIPVRDLISKHKIPLGDLLAYLPAPADDLERSRIEVHYLGYYLKWTPQECYYYAAKHVGFEPRPVRSEGTYSKYNSIDDKIDDLHYYCTFIKYGLGRASYDASQEIRNNHLTREEAVALVKKFDGERPKKYLKDVLDYIGLSEDAFDELCDKFRSPHLWSRAGGKWALVHQVN